MANCFVPRDLENWHMTLKTIGHLSYAAPTFVHHFMNSNWSYSPETPNLGQIDDFLGVWPWNLTEYLEEQYGTSFKQHQALCIILSPYVNSNWSYGLETAKWGHDFCDLDLWPLTLTFCMDIVSVNVNNSWKFQDDTMRGTLSKRCDRRTDRQTDRRK